MTIRITTVTEWNERHTGAMRFPYNGFVVIAGTNVILRPTLEAAEKLAVRLEPLTDEQIAASL